jgi:hypothetical protein
MESNLATLSFTSTAACTCWGTPSAPLTWPRRSAGGRAPRSSVALTATASYLAAHHTGPLAPAIAATHGYTTAFAVAAAILGLGVILAIVLLPSRRRLAEVRTGAAEPTPSPQPQQQQQPQAIPVALTGCSPVIHPVSGAAVAAGRGSHLVRS